VAIEGCSEITGKWAKKAEKEYEAVNTEAGRYFSLLAVSPERKTWLNFRKRREVMMPIGQGLVDDTPMQVSRPSQVVHLRVEKAYRKSAKSLTDTSLTHVALLHLQNSLIADVQRADADHIDLLGKKQSSLLLSIAAHAGNLGTGLTNYHSESLKKAATSYRDIEYCTSPIIS
jgi:hypothetical protein